MNPLAEKRVLVVGLGGLGCPAAVSLAKAGVGHVSLFDPDNVELSNLQRQPLHQTSDLGRPKVESAADRLRAGWPRLDVETHAEAVGPKNAPELFARHDLVLDATDDAPTKFALSDAAVASGTPLVYAGALRLEGQAMLICSQGPCLRCLFEGAPADAPSCAQAGILGTVAGAVGALQALLGLEALQGRGRPGVLVRLDGRALRQRELIVRRALDCSTCGALA